MNALRILLTGATGQVGYALARRLAAHALITPTRAEMDLADPGSITAVVERSQPDLIINPAAYTAVDKAESEPDTAHRINTEGPRALAEAASRLGIAMIHFSTDYVFDGAGTAPYNETDPPGPVSVYGRTKLEGELAVASACDNAWILRTSWVYGARGGNFLKTILRLAQERDKLNIVDDQWGAPTWSHTIADAVACMLENSPTPAELARRARDTRGIYHLCARGQTNWHGYACRIVDAMPSLGLASRVHSGDIAAISSEAYPTAARRPKNSRLNTDKFTQTFGADLPHWDTALDECLRQMAKDELPYQTDRTGN